DRGNPKRVIHAFCSLLTKRNHPENGRVIERSVTAGKSGTYTDISDNFPPADGSGAKVLFYPPWTYDDTNSNNLAFGTNELRLSAAQGTDKWPISITLPGSDSGRV